MHWSCHHSRSLVPRSDGIHKRHLRMHEVANLTGPGVECTKIDAQIITPRRVRRFRRVPHSPTLSITFAVREKKNENAPAPVLEWKCIILYVIRFPLSEVRERSASAQGRN